ncbi:hypothetical protein [Adlercreutzia murintestinalis]|nr:hypothetical protein [Adlercreutzia murintestinalis]
MIEISNQQQTATCIGLHHREAHAGRSAGVIRLGVRYKRAATLQ